jgi:hypothetical protein
LLSISRVLGVNGERGEVVVKRECGLYFVGNTV